MQTQAPAASASPFEQIGGLEAVKLFVDRFYDVMEYDPAFSELRALHAPDLAPMRSSLAGFLTAWLGGPRDWFAQNPGKCMMSAHGRIPISRLAADQWLQAMRLALADCKVDSGLAAQINEAFARMAAAMVRD